ncbi:MAG: hypothetical protein U1D55_07710 [Phycisphaerae bacterium]
MLESMLELAGQQVRYRYFRTRRELRVMLQQFRKTRFRYLHLACHGNRDGFAFTLDELRFAEAARLFAPYLAGKRLFLSACSVGRRSFARRLFRASNCLSVVGPDGPIGFAEAAIIWAAFYSKMRMFDKKHMANQEIKGCMNQL